MAKPRWKVPKRKRHEKPAFSRKELERISGEKLPKREAMSAIRLLHGALPPHDF